MYRVEVLCHPGVHSSTQYGTGCTHMHNTTNTRNSILNLVCTEVLNLVRNFDANEDDSKHERHATAVHVGVISLTSTSEFYYLTSTSEWSVPEKRYMWILSTTENSTNRQILLKRNFPALVLH
jgi:hypothetical protein